MGSLIAGYVLAGVFLALAVIGTPRVVRHVEAADDAGLQALRRSHESRWTAVYPGIASVLSLAGGTMLVVRGHPVGWGWLGVCGIWVLAFLAARRQSREVLAAIGDRGRTIRSPRNERRLAAARRWVGAGLAAYVTTRIIGYAWPEPMPDGVVVAQGLLAIATVVAFLGWLVLRTHVYVSLDDDKREARRQESN